MKTIQGPGLFIAQFVSDQAPFNTLPNIARWAAGLGYRAIQIPTWEKRVFDLGLAAESVFYCEDVQRILDDQGLVISELSTHLQGQLIATHPAARREESRLLVYHRAEDRVEHRHFYDLPNYLGADDLLEIMVSYCPELSRTLSPWPRF